MLLKRLQETSQKRGAGSYSFTEQAQLGVLFSSLNSCSVHVLSVECKRRKHAHGAWLGCHRTII